MVISGHFNTLQKKQFDVALLQIAYLDYGCNAVLPEQRQPSPKTVILDLLRMTRHQPVAAAELVSVGKLFGFTESAVRVALTRLVSAGKLEMEPAAGYRLSADTDPLTEYVERWRLGDDRRRDWSDGRWLMVQLPRRPDRSARARSLKTLSFIGFREARDGLWVRPDNLAQPLSALRLLYRQLGLEGDALLYVGMGLPDDEAFRWASSLWDLDALRARYRAVLEKLARSRARLPAMTLEDAMAESFRIGGEAIHVLVKDPLLPDEIMRAPEREQLAQAMRDYDAQGRQLWMQKVTSLADGQARQTTTAE